MQLKMVGKGKTSITLEIVGEGHTFPNALRGELLKDEDNVETATYSREHPKIENPVLEVETRGEDPVKTLRRAAKNLGSRGEEVRKDLEREL